MTNRGNRVDVFEFGKGTVVDVRTDHHGALYTVRLDDANATLNGLIVLRELEFRKIESSPTATGKQVWVMADKSERIRRDELRQYNPLPTITEGDIIDEGYTFNGWVK